MKSFWVFFSMCFLFLIQAPGIGAYVWPTDDKFITSDFGPRDRGSGWKWHSGIDIRASVGTTVYAVADGIISWVDNEDNSSAGRWIRIDHGGGKESRYLHLDEINVSKDDVVSAGQIVGKSGNTDGTESGGDSHLHFDFGYSEDNGIHPLKELNDIYSNTGEPAITNLEPIVYENGGFMVLKGVTGIKTRVDTTTDKDLNEVKFFVDGEEKYSISYDPRTNCTEATVDPIGLGDDEFVWDNLDTAGLSEGTHQVEVRAGDAAGGVGSKTISIFVTNRTDDYLAAKGVKWIIPMGGGLEKSGEVDYPNSEWGQEWTGSVIAPGPAMGELTNSGEMLLLEVLSRGIAVTPETNIKFSLLGCKGGASVQTIGGYFGDTCSDASNGRLLGVNIIAYDSDNNMLAKAAETIYDYRKGETLIKYVWNSTWENYDIIIEDNADFKPEDGIIKTEIKPWELIQGKGADMTQISKWLISISCINYFWEGGMDVWADVSPVYFQYGIEGLNFDTAKSDSQEFGQITGPSSVSFNRTPKVTGSVSSTGGNIVGVWGRYASGEVSEWLITDAADGDFDSEYEGFIFTVPEELEAGEHFIELKSLNAQGEKDAVYSKVNFTVSASSSVLGDINAYVWPNPAKGVNLTIKVDCGIGNANVNLRIYTIAGELVFEKDISNYYNSAKGAYEYEWNTAGKASGVYVYLITAGQGEKTFRKTGKMAVIK